MSIQGAPTRRNFLGEFLAVSNEGKSRVTTTIGFLALSRSVLCNYVVIGLEMKLIQNREVCVFWREIPGSGDRTKACKESFLEATTIWFISVPRVSIFPWIRHRSNVRRRRGEELKNPWIGQWSKDDGTSRSWRILAEFPISGESSNNVNLYT